MKDMGEWSEYFEDFPEENPANWVDGRFASRLAAERRQAEQRFQEAQSKANAELHGMIAEAKRKTKARSLLVVEDCPQCGLKELNSYRIAERFYLCECQECGIYGNGTTHEEALARTADAFGEGLDWRERSLY
jgi:hypothetical protein